MTTIENKISRATAIICESFGNAAINGIIVPPEFDYEKLAYDIVVNIENNEDKKES